MSYCRRHLAHVLALWVAVLTGCGDHGGTPDAGDVSIPDGCASCGSTCESAGCLPAQRCEPSMGGALACTPETCEPGFEWVSGGCSPVVGATCEGDSSLAIGADCAVLHRSCVDDEDGVRCGVCDPGYVQAGSLCIEGPECTAAGCAAMGQVCVFASGTALCGGCNVGYSDVDGSCVPTTCDTCMSEHRTCDSSTDVLVCRACTAGYMDSGGVCVAAACDALGCAAQHRTCSTTPMAHCDDACEAGWVWDGTSGACRPSATCTDLDCGADRACIDGSGTQDAFCGCPSTEGWDSQKDGVGGCHPCGPGGIQSASNCSAAGEWPTLVNADGIDGGACFCMTRESYFPSASGRAEACDADGDGWVNSEARVVIDDQRANVHENARCDLRRVSEFELRSDEGAIDRVILDSALPLYESPRNDGASSEQHAEYGLSAPRQLEPRYLNSLTKACVAPGEDYNDDDVLDVIEAQDMQPGDAILAALRPYYREYVRFSYFVELHEGWFVPGEAGGGPSKYVIQERPRLDTAPRGVAIQHPGPGDYWRSCQRHDDPLYAADPPTLVGADFLGRVMHHHSEFKCVVGATLSAYGQANANAETQPWSVFSGGGSTAGWTEGGTSVDVGKANACDLTGADYQAAGAASVNPEFPGFACTEADLDTTGTRAQWIVVNYLNAGLDETTPPTPEYRRGCINECVELTVAACDGYDGAPAGFRCDAAYAANFGKIRCGCGMDYSGPHTSCALGCPNTSGQAGHFMSPGLDVYTRAGDGPLYWMCLDPSASAGGTLASGEFRLRGQVPATSTSGTLMHSELPDGGVGYHLTGRARLEVQPFP